MQQSRSFQPPPCLPSGCGLGTPGFVKAPVVSRIPAARRRNKVKNTCWQPFPGITHTFLAHLSGQHLVTWDHQLQGQLSNLIDSSFKRSRVTSLCSGWISETLCKIVTENLKSISQTLALRKSYKSPCFGDLTQPGQSLSIQFALILNGCMNENPMIWKAKISVCICVRLN